MDPVNKHIVVHSSYESLYNDSQLTKKQLIVIAHRMKQSYINHCDCEITIFFKHGHFYLKEIPMETD
jgi:hypothetical protein